MHLPSTNFRDEASAPEPDLIRTIERARVVPFCDEEGDGMRRAGVFSPTKNFVRLSKIYRSDQFQPVLPTTCCPEFEACQPLKGTWLYGGLIYAHFGHFLAESISRLWALEYLTEPIEGVIYVPYFDTPERDRFVKATRPYFQRFAPEVRTIHTAFAPTLVDRLIIPNQSFGLGKLATGSEAFRYYIRRRIGRMIEPKGAPKIYISRSKLQPNLGRYFGEALIESWLESEGYQIFHPQEHDLEAQIAHYKAAEHIISSDASALHLAGMVVSPQTRVSLIRRRFGNQHEVFERQFEAFASISIHTINRLTPSVYAESSALKVNSSKTYTQLDLPLVAQDLHASGAIQNPDQWRNLTREELDAEIAKASVGYKAVTLVKIQ